MLDAVGDLSLAGSPLLGTYRSFCGGHRMNFAVLEACSPTARTTPIVEAGRAARRGYAEIGNASPFRLTLRNVTEAHPCSSPRSAPIGRAGPQAACPILAIRLAHKRPRWGWLAYVRLG